VGWARGKESRHSLNSDSVLPLAEFIHPFISDSVPDAQELNTVAKMGLQQETGSVAARLFNRRCLLLEESASPTLEPVCAQTKQGRKGGAVSSLKKGD